MSIARLGGAEGCLVPPRGLTRDQVIRRAKRLLLARGSGRRCPAKQRGLRQGRGALGRAAPASSSAEVARAARRSTRSSAPATRARPGPAAARAAARGARAGVPDGEPGARIFDIYGSYDAPWPPAAVAPPGSGSPGWRAFVLRLRSDARKRRPAPPDRAPWKCGRCAARARGPRRVMWQCPEAQEPPGLSYVECTASACGGCCRREAAIDAPFERPLLARRSPTGSGSTSNTTRFA